MAKKNKKIKQIDTHPEALAKVQEVKMATGDRQEFVDNLREKVKNDISAREQRDEKLLRWYKKRYGIRPATKSFPFPGASNIHIYLTDEKIRKMKPNYINLAFEGDPVVDFQIVGDTPLQVAQNAELLMDWLLKYRMNQAPGLNYFRALSISVDRMLEKGKGFLKVIWDYIEKNETVIINLENIPQEIKTKLADPLLTEEELIQMVIAFTKLDPNDGNDVKQIFKVIEQFKKRETIIKYKKRVVVYSGPRVMPIDDKDLIVPTFATDIQSCPRITHKIYLTINDLKVRQKNGKYENVNKVLENYDDGTGGRTNTTGDISTSTDALESLKRTREGVEEMSKNESELVEIWEIYTLYDIDGDGVDEKVVLTLDPVSGEVLRFIEFPYDHGKWPFIVLDFELNDDRFYSQRGLPELLDHYQTELTVQENAKLDRMTLANSLQFKYRIGTINPNNVRFIPGQGIPVHRMDDVQELQIANLDISFDREMDKIRGLAETYIGQPDLDLSAFTSGSKERRTAFEVSEVVNLGKQVFSFDARLFKGSLHNLYDQVFELWIQYGPDEIEIKVTGENSLSKIKKADIIGNFIIVPNAEFSILSRTLEQQRAFAILQQAIADTSGATNQYKAWENYLLKVDPRAAKRILNDEETFKKIQEIQQEERKLEVENKKQIAGRSPGKSGGGLGGNIVSQGGGSQVA